MKSTIIAATLFSALALAGPVKRAIVTVWEMETKTVWVTATPSSTAFNQPIGHGINPDASIVASSTHSTAPVQTSAEPDYSKLDDYARPILQQHNIHRANHSVDPLQWDNELVQWSKQIADTCVYKHSNAAGDGNYGQNIGAGAPGNEVPALITNGMYNAEIGAYPGYDSEPSMSNFHVWGHFSQIVWNETKTVGCYTTQCKTLGNVGTNVAPYFTVCNYRPAGNVMGAFTKNVFRPMGEKSVVIPSPN